MIEVGDIYAITKNWPYIATNKTITYYCPGIVPGEVFEVLEVENGKAIKIRGHGDKIYEVSHIPNLRCLFGQSDINGETIKLVISAFGRQVQNVLSDWRNQ